MHLKTVTLALAHAGVSAALGRHTDTLDNSNASDAIARSFIIEYTPGNVHRRENLESDGDINFIKSFNTDVFNGAAIETDRYNIESLSALPDVACVWPNERIYIQPTEVNITNQLPSRV
ncbi:hypothetical protein H9Q73_014298 [Fusarium xylarioides]|nr:hypothetical protein H9Q73_014298 [Fusarium xylarioides]